jgi:hypothetical protein
VVAARANAPVLERWQAGICAKLTALARGERRRADVGWDFLGNAVLAAVMDGIPAAARAQHLRALDRDASGFMPEHRYFGEDLPDPRRRYERYWFGSEAGIETALLPGQSLIGLHHSWTPAWYRSLLAPEVLAHPCLLSRLLERLLRP